MPEPNNAEAPRPRGAHFAPRKPDPSPRPDETAVFLAAAERGRLKREPVSGPRPDETAVFIAAAQHHPHPGVATGRGGHFAAPASGAADTADTATFTRMDAADATAVPSSEDAGEETTARMGVAPAAGSADEAAASGAAADDDFSSSGDYESVGRSATLMTGLIIVSRLTGFARTWLMGVAFGVSLLASSYNIANNLPNMLYELVMGGMLVTAFLPVYMDARRQGGKEGANAYVGNLLSILLVLLGVVSVLCIVFAPALIFTQSFMGGGSEMDTAVYFFRFFAIQILFYGLSSVFSGVLNAHRDYFWSNFGPILNNVVVITSFALYPLLEQVNPELGVTVLAVGTTAGVFVQMACQIPALGRHGIHPRLHIDLHDPLLKKTLSLGIPTVVATLCTLVTNSVMNSAALAVEPDRGASIIAYARLWYTLPYALLAVSLNTALYTELARDATRGDDDAVRDGMARGIAQQLFFLVPFALYLIVFSFPLNMIYCSGKFDLEGVEMVSAYLRFLAVSLPLYGVCMLMQKGCSALRNMKPYAAFMLAGAVAEIAWTMTFAVGLGGGMAFIALSATASYVVSDIGAIAWMRHRLRGIRLGVVAHGLVFGLVLGGLGAAAGAGVLHLLETFVAPLVTYLPDGTVQTASIVQTIGYIVVAGIVSLIVTFVPAVLLKLPEANMLRSIIRRGTGR